METWSREIVGRIVYDAVDEYLRISGDTLTSKSELVERIVTRLGFPDLIDEIVGLNQNAKAT